jgi:hypothetical protein
VWLLLYLAAGSLPKMLSRRLPTLPVRPLGLVFVLRTKWPASDTGRTIHVAQSPMRSCSRCRLLFTVITLGGYYVFIETLLLRWLLCALLLAREPEGVSQVWSVMVHLGIKQRKKNPKKKGEKKKSVRSSPAGTLLFAASFSGVLLRSRGQRQCARGGGFGGSPKSRSDLQSCTRPKSNGAERFGLCRASGRSAYNTSTWPEHPHCRSAGVPRAHQWLKWTGKTILRGGKKREK